MKDVHEARYQRHNAVAYLIQQYGDKDTLQSLSEDEVEVEYVNNHNLVNLKKDLLIDHIMAFLKNGESRPEGWIIVPHNRIFYATYASGSLDLENASPWKLHISINMDQMFKAMPIILNHLLSPDAPLLGFKILNVEMMKSTGYQGSKQIALLFSESVINDTATIQKLLSDIQRDLKVAGISGDTVPINTESNGTKAIGKFDETILNDDGTPSIFHYRNENVVVFDKVKEWY